MTVWQRVGSEVQPPKTLDDYDKLGLATDVEVEETRVAVLQEVDRVKTDLAGHVGLPHGAQVNALAPGPTVSIKDYGADFGAIGDGVVRKLSAAVVADKANLGFSGAHRLDDMDVEDTEDWLSAVLALKDLKSKGGGNLYIPKPSVTYPIRRFIPIPTGVPIGIYGDGFDPDIFDISNVCDLGVGWELAERRVVFQPSNWKDNCIDPDFAGKSTIVDIAPVDVAYTSIIPLLAGGVGVGGFVVGSRVVVYTAANYTVFGSKAPNRSCLRRVVDISGDTLLLDEVIPFRLVSGNGKVARMGTGSDGSLGGAPFDFMEDLKIRGLNTTGSTLLAYGSAGRRCEMEDLGIRADKAPAVGNNGGLFLNGYADSAFRRFHILTANRGVEVKGMSGQRWQYEPNEEKGGTGLLLQDFNIKAIGTVDAVAPLVSIGESSNAKFERFSLSGNDFSWSSFFRIDDSEITIIRGLNLEGAGADASKIALEVTGHRAPASPFDRAIIDIDGIRLGGKPNSWVRTISCQDPLDGRPKPILIDNNLRAETLIGSNSLVAYTLPFVGYGSVSDFASRAGQTLGFTAASTLVSLMKGILGATAAQLGAIGDWINTGYKGWGRPVFDTTNNKLYFPIGRDAGSKWRPYDNQSGTADITPV